MALFTGLLLLGFAAEVLAQATGMPEAGLDELVERHGLVPREWLRAVSGAGSASLARLFSPLTAIFLHAGPVHLAVNLVVLWVVGPPVERRVGGLRVTGLLLGTGLLAAAVQVAADPHAFVPLLGASGVVAGLVGAALGLRCLPAGGRLAAGLVVVLELAALASGPGTHPGSPAHLGGLLAGALAGLLLARRGGEA